MNKIMSSPCQDVSCDCEGSTPPESRTPVDLIPVWEKAIDTYLEEANELYNLGADWNCVIPINIKDNSGFVPKLSRDDIGSLSIRLYDDKFYSRLEFKSFVQYIPNEKAIELKDKYIKKIDECNINILKRAELI